MPPTATTPAQKIAGGLERALGRFRDLHPDMTALQLAVFLVIAKAGEEGISQSALYRYLDTTDSTVSRTLAILSDIGGRKVAPLDLIEIKVNPLDRRERLITLTRKGTRILNDVVNDLT
jgi:DNA-binding MarR family transcriptional regulator